MTRTHRRLLALAAFIVFDSCSLLLCPLRGQQIHHNGFENRQPGWTKGNADAPANETVHNVTDQTAHTGQYSEHIQLTADRGNYIYYLYPVGRAPVGEELTISVFLKANRPGMQILARLVLPHERNPSNLEEPLTTLLRGERYQTTSRWQPLELRSPWKQAREQQQLLRAQLNRDVDFTDAYIDAVLLNLYGGPGATEVWIDDLEVGPVVDGPPPPFRPTNRVVAPPGADKTPAPVAAAPPQLAPRGALVELNQDQLLVGGKRFFFRAIRLSDTPAKTLYDAGFNTLWVDANTPPAVLEQAVSEGFWLVPSLPVTATEPDGRPRFASADLLSQTLNRFQVGDAVLFWDLGNTLPYEQAQTLAPAAQVIRTIDRQHPLGADVWDGFRPYSRTLDLVSAHRFPFMTGLELDQYRQWLNQRRLLARPGAFMWTWIQTQLPDWYTNLVYNRPASAGFDEPIGPQPEQIRLLTYTALAAGCRGLGFWSDRFLADSHQGRDRLLALAVINQELQMLEPLLVSQLPADPRWIDTSVPEVKAAVLRTHHGVLVLPMWVGRGVQFVPGQSATAKLTMVVPEVPIGLQAWEISPAEVHSLQTERVVGGTKLTIPEFGLTTAVLFSSETTSPTSVVVRLQDQSRRMRKLAAQFDHDLAEEELKKVVRIETQLEQAGHTLPDGVKLLENARTRLQNCVHLFNDGDFREAYAEAERILRPLRIMMRAQWEQAIKDLDTPVASPYAVSFFTLPQHWAFMNEIKGSAAGANILPDSGFEPGPSQSSARWVPEQITLDDVQLIAAPSTEQPKEGKQCLLLQIKPKDAQAAPPEALDRTYLAYTSPPVQAQPGSVVRISGWVRIPKAITASADGALLFDSVGGEALAVRLTRETAWKKYTLYRRVPASGTVQVTVALTGIGSVYFDDLRVEPLGTPGTVPIVPPSPAPNLALGK